MKKTTKAKTKRTRKSACSKCGRKGHNVRTCGK